MRRVRGRKGEWAALRREMRLVCLLLGVPGCVRWIECSGLGGGGGVEARALSLTLSLTRTLALPATGHATGWGERGGDRGMGSGSVVQRRGCVYVCMRGYVCMWMWIAVRLQCVCMYVCVGGGSSVV